jgi:hypothetical protein
VVEDDFFGLGSWCFGVSFERGFAAWIGHGCLLHSSNGVLGL